MYWLVSLERTKNGLFLLLNIDQKSFIFSESARNGFSLFLVYFVCTANVRLSFMCVYMHNSLLARSNGTGFENVENGCYLCFVCISCECVIGCIVL